METVWVRPEHLEAIFQIGTLSGVKAALRDSLQLPNYVEYYEWALGGGFDPVSRDAYDAVLSFLVEKGYVAPMTGHPARGGVSMWPRMHG